MKQLILMTVFCLGAICFAVVVPEGVDAYSDGAEVIYAQSESAEVYRSGAVVPYTSAGKWKIAYDDPITAEYGSSVLVLAFRLPDRGGKLIEARSLMFYVGYVYNNRIDRLDLYGAGFVPASEADPNNLIDPKIHYTGVWAADKNATALDEGILIRDEVVEVEDNNKNLWFGSNEEGALRLSCYLNDLYDEKGAQEGDYVFLRLNYNAKYSTYTNVDVLNYDTENNARIYYDLVDSLSEPCPAPAEPAMSCPQSLRGDVTGDCLVDLADFYALANNWLQCDRIPARLCY